LAASFCPGPAGELTALAQAPCSTNRVGIGKGEGKGRKENGGDVEEKENGGERRRVRTP